MAKPPWEKLGDAEWRRCMDWGYGIYKMHDYEGNQWCVLDASEGEEWSFDSHAEATDYVRSQIAKG